jgi:hypothetical protein
MRQILTLCRDGKRIARRSAIIEITTRSSINVKPLSFFITSYPLNPLF